MKENLLTFALALIFAALALSFSAARLAHVSSKTTWLHERAHVSTI